MRRAGPKASQWSPPVPDSRTAASLAPRRNRPPRRRHPHRNPSSTASNTPPASTSSSAARRRRKSSTSSARYAETCIPIPRTDRAFLLVRLLPAVDPRQAARPRQRELDGAVHAAAGWRGLRARSSCTCPTSPPTARPSPTISTAPSSKAASTRPEDVSHFLRRKPDIFGLKVRTAARSAPSSRPARAPRHPAFNLTHMKRGRNAYQASHCYSLADHMVGDAEAAIAGGARDRSAGGG